MMCTIFLSIHLALEEKTQANNEMIEPEVASEVKKQPEVLETEINQDNKESFDELGEVINPQSGYDYIHYWKSDTRINNVGEPFTTEYYLAHDKDLGIKTLYYKNKFSNNIFPSYTYPDSISDDYVFDIETSNERRSLEYDSGAPETKTTMPGKLIYSNSSRVEAVEAPFYLDIKDDCLMYRGGSRCEIGIFTNNEGLEPGRLSTTTSEFKYSGLTLSQIYSLGDGKLLLHWGFGDAGAYSTTYSLWDTNKQTNKTYIGFGGMIGEFASLKYGEPINKSFEFATPNMRGYGTTSPALNMNPFEDTLLVGNKIEKEDICLRFYPIDLSSLSNDVYIEFTNSCGMVGTEDKLPSIAVWYTFNPVTEELKQVTDIIPRMY